MRWRENMQKTKCERSNGRWKERISDKHTESGGCERKSENGKEVARNGCLCIDIACKCQNAEQCEFFQVIRGFPSKYDMPAKTYGVTKCYHTQIYTLPFHIVRSISHILLALGFFFSLLVQFTFFVACELLFFTQFYTCVTYYNRIPFHSLFFAQQIFRRRNNE